VIIENQPVPDWVKALPPNLRERPLDHRRKVPVPWMNEEPDGTPNFVLINEHIVRECGEKRLCGICGKPLDYWIAFVGGPISFANRAYSDPPFHRECARTAMTLCPHISRKVHRRVPDEKLPPMAYKSDGSVEEKPEFWVIGITRDFTMIPWGRGVLFRAATMKDAIVFGYDDEGHLKEVVR
jgi:hypothetical protein